MELKDNKHYPSLIGDQLKLEIISTSIGEPPYRGRQSDWIYEKADDITKMTDLKIISR